MSVAGRVVLVTGASSGLGAVFAQALAASGARVVAGARRIDRIEQLVASIRAGGGEAHGCAIDVSDPVSVAQAFDRAERLAGPVTAVLANAGMTNDGLALELDADRFRAVLDTNVTGVFLTLREAARRIIARGDEGRMVAIASVLAEKVVPGVAPYAASKAAVVQLARALALEWAPHGIGVNSVSPGYIRTDINQAFFDSRAGERLVQGFPRKRLMQPDDLVPLVTLLLSDGARAITGADFTVDDAQTL